MSALFISDLHLSTAQPDKLEAFNILLNDIGSQFDSIYILGDLFEEFWVGNDDITPPNPEILAILKSTTESGIKVFFIKGNRELLLEANFSDITGVTVMDDISEIMVAGQKALIMHGDLLCSMDWKYQLFRKVITNSLVKFLISMLPYGLRSRLAHGLRPGMTRHKNSKTDAMMDVDHRTVENIMSEYNVSLLIHGHTHKPGIDEFTLDNKPVQRIVLGDWYRKGEILINDGDKLEIMGIEDFLLTFSQVKTSG
jgi:UDP-2,3-diacylglucosamine hydrolase